MPGLRAIWALCVTTSNIYDLVFGNSGCRRANLMVNKKRTNCPRVKNKEATLFVLGLPQRLYLV